LAAISGELSQGGVKVPTGGNAAPITCGQAHERSTVRCYLSLEVSRFGEIPEPTVIVRIKEKVS